MLTQLLFTVLASVAFLSLAKGAGRKFPLEARKFTVEHFKRINPSIVWDETFFLSDYSSRFSLCKYTNQPGIFQVNRRTPFARQPITGIRAVTEGHRATVMAATRYIRQALDTWDINSRMRSMVLDSTAVGCSIRPMCRGQSVITCLFSGAMAPPTRPPTLPPTRPPTTRRTYPPTRPPTLPPTARPPPTAPTGIQRALAFTPQEYHLTEQVTGQILSSEWDRSHTLENLSGYETLCEMIHTNSWPFETARDFGDYYGILGIIGRYGYAPNLGSTPNAMREILQAWNWREIQFNDMGCSLIPDCIEPDGQMYVVVSCLFN